MAKDNNGAPYGWLGLDKTADIEHKKNTMIVARELSRQQTAKAIQKKCQTDLFSSVCDKDEIIELQTKGELYQQITEGLDLGVLGSKVLIELCKTLYEQSEQSGAAEELLGHTYEIAKSLEKDVTDIMKPKRAFGRDTDGELTTAIAPYVVINLAQFTKGVYGGVKINNIQRRLVLKALKTFDKKRALLRSGDEIKTCRILAIEDTKEDSKTGTLLLLVRLSGLFRRNIGNDFIVLRKDINKRLGSKPSEMAIRLMWLLAEAYSFRKKSGLIYRISKSELLQRIAVNKSYQSKPKRMKEDLIKAVEKMKDLYLLENNSGAYKEETGANGELISIFKLNPKYNTEGEEVDYTIID